MSGIDIVHGAPGSGSAPIEAALTLLGLPYRGEDQAPWESAAILIYRGDLNPEAGLAPALASAARRGFLRWMTFVSATIYALYWIRDEPGRYRFYAVAPGLAEAIRRVDTDPRLTRLWGERFPFAAGWER